MIDPNHLRAICSLCIAFLWQFSCVSWGQSAWSSALEQADQHFSNNQYALAQEKYLKVLLEVEKEKNFSIAAKIKRKVGNCHYYLRDNDDALRWYYAYLETIQLHALDSLQSDAYYIINAMYIEANNSDSVAKYSKLAISEAKKNNEYARLSQIYSTLAEFHLNGTQDKSEIERVLREAERYGQLAQNDNMLGFVKSKYYNYAFFLLKDYPQALRHVNESISYFNKANNTEAILNGYRAKAECLILMQDTSARSFMNKWFVFKDSIFNAEKASGIAKYETWYETEKKEMEIAHQKSLYESEKKSKFYLYLLFGFIVLGLIALFVIYRQRQQQATEIKLRKQQDKALKEIFEAEQKERIRIARDLHDSIGQKLSVMKMLLSSKPNDGDLGKISSFIDETAGEVRTISHNLIPEILKFGLLKALQDLTERIKMAGEVTTELTYSEELKNLNLPLQVELSIYRIIQEILSNTLKHAQAKHIHVKLALTDHGLAVEMKDDGIGFDSSKIEESTGLGWKNILARTKLINGQFQVVSEPQKGSLITLKIPLS
jgi:two-component system, NarL family, sensor kinase